MNIRMKRLAIVAAATVVAMGAVSAVNAIAAPGPQFSVQNGDIRPSKGTPATASGTMASLWSENSVATTTLSGSGTVVIGAIGSNCNGWPTIRVSADGKVLGETTITNNYRYGAYAVGSALGGGDHRIQIQFVNDYVKPNVCDRNVHVGSASLAISGSKPAPAPAPAPAPKPSGNTGGGKPGPSNTGVPDGTNLRIHNGDLTVTTPGAVVDGLDVRGFVDIRANNVTIKNTIVRGRDVGKNFRTLISNFQGNTGLLVQDSTLAASYPSGYTDGLKGMNFTARRLDVSKAVDTTLIYGDNVTIENSWYHDNTYVTPWPYGPDNRTHSDSLQVVGGRNIKITGNTLEKSENTAVILTQDHSRVSNVQITDNWLSGGACTVNIADKGKGPINGLTLKNNKFGPSAYNCQILVYGSATQPAMSGNVKEGSNAPAGVQRR